MSIFFARISRSQHQLLKEQFSRYTGLMNPNVAMSSTSSTGTGGPVENAIRSKLTAGFSSHDYLRLDIANESHKHNVPKGSESHFNVLIVSDAFEGTFSTT